MVLPDEQSYSSYLPAPSNLRGQVQIGYQPKEVQISFMNYTAQMIIKDLRNNHKEVLERFRVKRK